MPVPDLAQRAATAAVAMIIAGFALWVGGMAWTVFVLIVGLGVWFEWRTLVLLGARGERRRAVWQAAGAIYCGLACAVLLVLRAGPFGRLLVLLVLVPVFATDIGAYFAGRAIGGARIAPGISPSKTWAGLAGGMAASALALLALLRHVGHLHAAHPGRAALIGLAIAVVAQVGDFFESWLKRRAGVKDSGRLLPGHGGLFDRVDGLIAVLFVVGLVLPVLQIMHRGTIA